jgi:tagatose 6-phosphate kinase
MARIVVLTPNPAIDVTYRLPSTQLGRSHLVDELTRRAGGKGVNVCRALVALGHDAVSLSPLGRWTGDWFAEELQREGIPHRSTRIAGETRFTVAFMSDDGAHPTVLREPGPRIDDIEWAAVSSDLDDLLRGAAGLIISGSLPPDSPPELIGEWVSRGRAARVLTAVDSSGDALLHAARAGADLLKPNADEALHATNAATIADAAGLLRAAGARQVVISSGEDGVDGFTDERVHVDAVRGVSGNPTGAGDAATAGVVSALIEGLPFDAALRRGAALGAAAVLRPVAGEVDLTAYRRFLEEPDR